MLFSSIKEINRLISKGMSNIYLKVAIEKKLTFLNFDFPVHVDITGFYNFLLQIKN